MEPQKKVTWKDLRVGLFALSSFIVIAITILLMGGGKITLFKDYIRYRTFFPGADGLKAGSEVWLAGVEVGEVLSVRFADPNDLEAADAIEVVLKVDADVRHRIRTDSVASLRTIGLLGDKYVEIKAGTAEASVVPPNGTIAGISLSTFDELIGVGRTTAQGFNQLMVELRQLTSDVNNEKGTLGKIIHGEELYRNLNTSINQMTSLIKTAQNGPGTAGKMMSDPALYDNLVVSTTSAQRTMALLDSTLRTTHALLLKIQGPESTIGKLTSDRALYDRMQATLNRVDAITRKIERGEGTVGQLVQNDTLSQEAEGLLIDMRALIKDVRDNPRKYIKVSVF